MTQLAPLDLGDGLVILVEASGSATEPSGSKIAPAGVGDAGERALQSSTRLTAAVAGLARHVVGSFRQAGPAEQPSLVVVEFSLDVSIEGTVYVVKGAGTGTVKIRAEWNLGRDQP